MSEKAATIVAIGDSLTYGFPLSPDYSWVAIVSRKLNNRIVNQGVCGETTRDMLRRFARDVIRLKPSQVIVTGGSNDAFAGVAADDVGRNVGAMIKIALENGITPIIGLAPPLSYWPEETLLSEYREIMRRLAAQYNLQVIDFYTAMLDADGGGLKAGLHSDGVHPNSSGYAVMAEVAEALLQKALPAKN